MSSYMLNPTVLQIPEPIQSEIFDFVRQVCVCLRLKKVFDAESISTMSATRAVQSAILVQDNSRSCRPTLERKLK